MPDLALFTELLWSNDPFSLIKAQGILESALISGDKIFVIDIFNKYFLKSRNGLNLTRLNKLLYLFKEPNLFFSYNEFSSNYNLKTVEILQKKLSKIYLLCKINSSKYKKIMIFLKDIINKCERFILNAERGYEDKCMENYSKTLIELKKTGLLLNYPNFLSR